MSAEKDKLILIRKINMVSSLDLHLEAKLNIQKCIICQNINDNKGDKNLTSTENGRLKIIQCSKFLKDELISQLTKNDLQYLKYHVKTCYPR